ncbi:MAG: YybS family protein [Spirochaetia bacterium]|nr:YybS family protein [Spirochaetia bacterium]
MVELLLSFPADIFWGLIVAWTLSENQKKLIFWIFLAVVLTIGFFLPQPVNLFFWLPGGAAVILMGVTFFLVFKSQKGMISKKTAQKLPTRDEIQKSFDGIEDLDQKKEKYFVFIKKIKNYYQKIHQKTTEQNTNFLILLFLSSFALNFLVLMYMYYSGDIVSNYLQDSFKPFAEFYKSMGISVEEVIAQLKRFSPAIIFLQNAISLFFLFTLIRKIYEYKKKETLFLGRLSFFKMPDNIIWLFILSGGVLALSYITQIPDNILMVFENLTAIISIMYVFQGLGTIWIFCRVRFLPLQWIILSAFITSMLWPGFLFFYIIMSFFWGLGEFWFSFRKRALHPRIESN